MPNDVRSQARVTNVIHKRTNIKNLVEPLLGTWLHCPICM